MGWLLWLFFVWFMISRLTRRRRRRSGWYAGPGMAWVAMYGARGACGALPRRASAQPARAPELSARERRERSIAELRRRYVADDITVEEYEAGLDRVLHNS